MTSPEPSAFSIAVYQELRSEMTEIFSSLRNWILAQYAAIGALVVAMVGPETGLKEEALCMLLIALVIFASNRYCSNLWRQAFRIGSYLLVNFELDTGIEPRAAWFTANRSEPLIVSSNKSAQTSSRFLLRYRPITGLKNFYIHQFILVGLLLTGMVFRIGPIMHKALGMRCGVIDDSLGLVFVACCLVELFMFAECIVHILFAAQVHDSIMRNWIEYKKDVKGHSKEYLKRYFDPV